MPTATCSSICGIHGHFQDGMEARNKIACSLTKNGFMETKKHAMLMFINAGSRTNGTRVCSIHQLAVEGNQVLYYSCMTLKIHAESPGVLPQSFTLCHCLQSPCVSSLTIIRNFIILAENLGMLQQSLIFFHSLQSSYLYKQAGRCTQEY